MSTDILRAIRMNDVKLVTELVNSGSDLLFKDEFGYDALFYSVTYPNDQIFRIVTSEKVNLNTTYQEKKGILHAAIEGKLEKKGFYHIIKYLIDTGMDLNSQDIYGNTPLWYACISYGINEQTIRYLLENGANMDIKNVYGNSTFLSAKENKRVELIKILKEYGH